MLQQAKLPYVRFSTDVVNYVDEEGHTEYKNKYFATITPAGGKDEVYKEAESWLDELRQKAMVRGPFDVNADVYAEWHRRFSAMFDQYKKGQELDIEGTPLKASLAFNPAELAACESIHIHTLEQLAECNEEAIRRLGMGGRTMKNKAAKILENKIDSRVAEENAALRLKVAQLEEKVNQLLTKSDLQEADPVERKKPGPKPKTE